MDHLKYFLNIKNEYLSTNSVFFRRKKNTHNHYLKIKFQLKKYSNNLMKVY
jgi:hypothetical protein